MIFDNVNLQNLFLTNWMHWINNLMQHFYIIFKIVLSGAEVVLPLLI